MRKIAYILPSFEIGGAEIQTLNQINWMNERGYDVSLIVLSNVTSLLDQLIIDPKKILVLKENDCALYRTATLIKLFRYIPRIAAFIYSNKIQVLVGVMNVSHFVARLIKIILKFTLRAPIIIIYHRCAFYKEFPADSFLKKIANKINSALGYMLDNVNIFISKDVEQDITQNSSVRKGFVIYNSVKPVKNTIDDALVYLRERKLLDYEYYLVFPGRFHIHKGHAVFINAFKIFVDRQGIKPGDILVIVIGKGDLEADIKRQIEENNLVEFFHIAGQQPHSTLLSFFKYSNLVVVPSNHEGFGNVAIEALMTKSLLLVSNAGGLKEIVDDGRTGYIFDKGNIEDLHKKLTFLYTNRQSELVDREELYDEYQNRFSLDTQMKKLIEIIKSVK